MSAVLTILLWLILILLVILAGALLTPVKLRLHLRSSPSLKFRIEASAFGGVTPHVRILDSTRRRKHEEKKPKKKKTKARSKRSFAGGTRLVAAIPRLLSDILSAFHVDYLNVDAEFGLPDPADTGHVYGCLTPFLYGAPLPAKVVVSLRPDFNRACFAGEMDASLHITPAALLPPAVRLAWRAFGPSK